MKEMTEKNTATARGKPTIFNIKHFERGKNEKKLTNNNNNNNNNSTGVVE